MNENIKTNENTSKSTSNTSDNNESFENLLSQFLAPDKIAGSVVKGKVINVENGVVLIDVGLKSEGCIPVKEFSNGTQPAELKTGDLVDVYIEKIEGPNGEIVLSREKARREAAWNKLEKSFENGERVTGIMFSKVKGGFTVDLSGAIAFLPGSQVDIRPIKDIDSLMHIEQPFQILKMDRIRGNIVVSRRAILEESQAEAKSELISNLQEGQTLQGIAKNITDYGVFVDLGGIDGLLHVTDISWHRVNHPSEVLKIGDTIKVKIIKFNKEKQRISLGMKQLTEDPWKDILKKYPVGSRHKGRVTNVTDYGAFIELEPGIEGLIHVSEMSWTKKNIHPGKIVSSSQELEIQVLEIEQEKHRIALGLKQCAENPWESLEKQFPVGSEIKGTIKNITDFGLFVGLTEDIDGMVHMSDLSWDKPGEEIISNYKKGDTIKVKVLDIDQEKERVGLGMKQLMADPFESTLKNLQKGQIVTCEITKLTDNGLEVTIDKGASGFIHKNDFSRDKSECRIDRFAVGEKVDAKISSIDKKARSIILSIKAYEIEEEKKVMEKYGSTVSGASLGDILGAAIEKKKATMSDSKVEKVTEKKTADDKKNKPKKTSNKAKSVSTTKEKSKKSVKKTSAKKDDNELSKNDKKKT